MTDALVKHRDGIVGPWQGWKTPWPQYPIEDEKNLEKWEPWVRAAVLDFELLSHLHVSEHAETYHDPVANANKTVNECITLWHRKDVNAGNIPPSASFKRIATFVCPTDAIFKAQADLVDGYSDLREDRGSEILAQLGPPVAFWSSIVYLHPDRTRWTLELLDIALRLANFVEMRLKHALASRRPNEYSPQIQPMILTPGHSAFPSGHATEAFMIAYVLWNVMKPKAPGKDRLWLEQLMRQASRVAINRQIAGVHFPVDSAAGALLGLTLGEYFVRRARPVGDPDQYEPWRFDGQRYPPAGDFDWRQQYDAPGDQRTPSASVLFPVFTDRLAKRTAQRSKLLAWLWAKAIDEWA